MRAMSAWLLLWALAAGAPGEGVPVVERVTVAQNQFLPADSLLFYVSTKAGDRYDELRLREGFRRLGRTGFLDDLRLDVQDGATGKVVTFLVQERKRVQVVDYRGNRAVSRSAIEGRLKEKDAAVRLDSFYDAARARRVESLIRELLAAKGRPFATVRHEARSLGGAAGQLTCGGGGG